MQSKVYRIIDVNLNRASEGLRVVEDGMRLIFEDKELSARIKRLRHRINILRKDREFNRKLLEERNTDTDPGKSVKYDLVLIDKTFEDIILMNLKRAMESVRVIEEFLKTINNQSWKSYKEIRFALYDVEKDIGARIFRKETGE